MSETSETEFKWAAYLFLILAGLGAAVGGAKINHPWSGGLVGVALWALVMLVATCVVRNGILVKLRAALAILAAAGLAVLVFVVNFEFDPANLGVPDSVITGNGGVGYSGRFRCTLYNASNFTISRAMVNVQTYNPKNSSEHSETRWFELSLDLRPHQTQEISVATGLRDDYSSHRFGSLPAETLWNIREFKLKTNLYHYFMSRSEAPRPPVALAPAPLIIPAPTPVPFVGPVAIPSKSTKKEPEVKKAPSEEAKEEPKQPLLLGYFTIGSSKDEVLTVQGTPTKPGQYTWEYGFSKVEFDRNGKVSSWYGSRTDRLKVKMVPVAPTSSNGYFTVGSSKDEVLAAQGTPTKPGRYTWEYGFSKVEFNGNGKVSGWSVSRTDRLRVKMQDPH
ncbi:MAG: hypothetical protein NDI58_03345 [Geothrix sp.]|nr:hypothetical protein [Geothrix sp.]